ncbi:MAG: glycosyltransferase [Lachnospiraceae bacterium]|nr:glycosyltransferase [Lachnospiraceae bacterium]
MKLSVAMAAYNGAEYIIEQLESIRTQTRPVDEVIICDDQSSDATVEVVREYIEKHQLAPDWRIEVNPKNLGYASNFIGAVKKTTGNLIFFCDQDDIWLPNRVREMEQLMTDHPEIQLLGSEFEPFVSSEDAMSVPEWELKQFKNDKSLEKLEYRAKNIFIGCQGCTMCIRRSFFEKTKEYWYEGWAHDEYVWKLALCMDGLYMYHAYTLRRRLHSSNVSLQKMRNMEKRIRFLKQLSDSHRATLRFAKALGLSAKKQKLLERNIRATELRIELLEQKKYWNTFKLMFAYADCYHKRRSIPVELYMAIKG